MDFDLLKAFGHNERVIKSDFFSFLDLVYIIRAEGKSNIKTMDMMGTIPKL